MTQEERDLIQRHFTETMDVMDKLIEPQGMIFGRIAGLDQTDLYTRPGKFIPVIGNPTDYQT